MVYSKDADSLEQNNKETNTMLANHASDNLFQAFDPAHLGEHCEELGENTDNIINACKLGFWFTEEDRVIADHLHQKYNYLVDIDMEG